MSNRSRVIQEMTNSMQFIADNAPEKLPAEAINQTLHTTLVIELATLTDELHNITLKLDKLIHEVGKRR